MFHDDKRNVSKIHVFQWQLMEIRWNLMTDYHFGDEGGTVEPHLSGLFTELDTCLETNPQQKVTHLSGNSGIRTVSLGTEVSA